MARSTKQLRTGKQRRSATPQETLRRALASEYVINSGASTTVGRVPGIKDSQQAKTVVDRILERAGGTSQGPRTA
ncbi:hypothetical protein ACFVTE_18250 [Arthrobacter sp. NPDC058097]|uniref:hypothetical protein n=1 Tax=Arthrobacter sp. NPDC058097 TaxID=3346340 RepID=UPI0036DB7031